MPIGESGLIPVAFTPIEPTAGDGDCYFRFRPAVPTNTDEDCT
jgi:hypothetical protein